MTDTERAILHWLANGDTGLSSEVIAYAALGIECRRANYPLDPADFNRCLLLVEEVPLVRESFSAIADRSPQWATIIEHWDELASLLRGEVGGALLWRAPKTYDRMRELLDT